MLKKLRMLLKARAWLRSLQLQGGGVLGILGGIQVWLASDDGRGVLEFLATLLNLMTGTVMGFFTSAVGLALILMRAKTEWSLAEKVAKVDKDPEKVAAISEVVNR